MLNLCLSRLYSARISIIIYGRVKGDNLDKDERGSEEENMTDMLLSRLFTSHILIALRGRRRGTVQPPSSSYHPPHLCLSP